MSAFILVFPHGHIGKSKQKTHNQTYDAKPQAPALSVTIPKAPFHMDF